MAPSRAVSDGLIEEADAEGRICWLATPPNSSTSLASWRKRLLLLLRLADLENTLFILPMIAELLEPVLLSILGRTGVLGPTEGEEEKLGLFEAC